MKIIGYLFILFYLVCIIFIINIFNSKDYKLDKRVVSGSDSVVLMAQPGTYGVTVTIDKYYEKGR